MTDSGSNWREVHTTTMELDEAGKPIERITLTHSQIEDGCDDVDLGYHPDYNVEARLNHVPSETEDGGSDSSESSRPGVIEYYPVATTVATNLVYANRKKFTDTIERCTENNDAAFDDAYDVESDISSIESPRDDSTIGDSAHVNPQLNKSDSCVVDLSGVQTSRYHNRYYDEVVDVQTDSEETPLKPTSGCWGGYQDKYDLYGSMTRTAKRNAQLENAPYREVNVDEAVDTPLLSRRSDNRTDMDFEMKELSRTERHLQTRPTPPFSSKEEVESTFPHLLNRGVSEDSKSSEDSTKQDAMKKKRKKRKTKSMSSMDADGDADTTDENGNPGVHPPPTHPPPTGLLQTAGLSTHGTSTTTTTTTTNLEATNNFHNRAFHSSVGRITPKDSSMCVSSDPTTPCAPEHTLFKYATATAGRIVPLGDYDSTKSSAPDKSLDKDSAAIRSKQIKKAKKEDKAKGIKAEDISGHQGYHDIETLLEFIENNGGQNKKKKSTIPENPTSSTHVTKRDPRDQKKVKSKTPEPRDIETDSTSSETVSIPEANSSKSNAAKRSNVDTGYYKLDFSADVEDNNQPKFEQDFKLVGGKKKKRAGDRKDEVERRPIRSITPPPTVSHTNKYTKAAQSSPITPPPTHNNTKLEERSLSPSAFPLLNGDLPSTGRRNSTGNAPDELVDHHGDTVGALLAPPDNAKISWAKIAASPKPKSGQPVNNNNKSTDKQRYDNGNYSCDGNKSEVHAKRCLDNALRVDDGRSVSDRSRSDSPPPRALSEEKTIISPNKSRDKYSSRDRARSTSERSDNHNSERKNRDPSSIEREVAPPAPASSSMSRDGKPFSAAKRDELSTASTRDLESRDEVAPPSVTSRDESFPVSVTSRDEEFPSLPRLANNNNKRTDFNTIVTGAHHVPNNASAAAAALLAADTPLLVLPLAAAAAAGAPTSKQAVIFLDDENYSPPDLGISFVFDQTLACEPPPELVAAVNAGQFNNKPSSDNPCSFGVQVGETDRATDIISFIHNTNDCSKLNNNNKTAQPINGLINPVGVQQQHAATFTDTTTIKPRDGTRSKLDNERRPDTTRSPKNSYLQDNHRFNVIDAVKFLQKEWDKIQYHKREGTMRVVEYSGE